MFKKLSRTAKLLIASVWGIIALLFAAGLAVSLLLFPFERPLPYALGLAVGGLLSTVKVVLLERSLSKTLDIGEGKQAENYARGTSLARYGLTLAVLVGVVLLRGRIGLWGTVLGLLSLQLAAYVANFIETRQKGGAPLQVEPAEQVVAPAELDEAPEEEAPSDLRDLWD